MAGQTNEAKTRGYSMTAGWGYVDSTYDVATREKLLEHLSPTVRAAVGTYREIEFYPIVHFSELLDGIARVASTDAAQAEAELTACGSFIARHATNTFLRLIMRVITPSIFAKKIPSLWSRDNTRGEFSVDTSRANDGFMVFTLADIDDFAHVGPVAKGWISFAMTTMGRKTESVTLSGWSLENPSPPSVEIRLQLAQ